MNKLVCILTLATLCIHGNPVTGHRVSVRGFHVLLQLSLKCWLNDSSLIGDSVLRMEVPFS
jgi:hypothetical protein